jgi:hypothetical protein
MNLSKLATTLTDTISSHIYKVLFLGIFNAYSEIMSYFRQVATSARDEVRVGSDVANYPPVLAQDACGLPEIFVRSLSEAREEKIEISREFLKKGGGKDILRRSEQ